MKNFNYFQPTDIRFGCGRVNDVGEIVAEYGKKCLLVTVPVFPALETVFEKIKKSLSDAGVEVEHFDGVHPNPTTESITVGTDMAEKMQADVILDVGGGSSMDSAKAIAVEAVHEGSCWDYLFYKTPPTEKTLPIIAISTTSGTGSQVTQVAVVTNTSERDKSALYNSIIYPKVSIVDPELMLTVPEHVTASTGFDVFCHAFEAMIHANTSPYIRLIAKEAVKIVAKTLPNLVKDLENIDLRTKMAWADTLAGLSIANAGVTLPHGMGMAIGGMYPQVMHGETLAIVYPACTRFTWESAKEDYAFMARLFDPQLKDTSDDDAAKGSGKAIETFLEKIGMRITLQEKEMPEKEIPALAKQCMVLPDYKNNPRIATPEEMEKLVKESYNK